jgi:hypothetical protein
MNITAPTILDATRIWAFEDHIEQLAVIADWKDYLHLRIAITELVFLYEDADVDLDALKAEVALFKKVCARLAWRPEP